MRRLNVWWDSRLVGELAQDRSGDLAFRYDPAWITDEAAAALSVSLPKQQEPFSRSRCRPFFAGLLPEESQRTGAARALGVSEANDFALLDGLGGDVAGALQLLPTDRSPPSVAYVAQPQPLTDRDIVDLLRTLPERPLLAGEHGLRLSLAGAQSKVPVVLVDGKVARPAPDEPTTHILKPPMAAFDATTENELAVMRLARAVGLDVASVEARIVDDHPFLLIERYDRISNADGMIRRLHQEDFCQALGVAPNQKYASEGGPVFKDGFALLRRVSAQPARDVLKLLDAALFNLVVGNADAHGKNFSLLYAPTGPRLAPLYDLLSTVMYPALAPHSAMKIGRAATLAELDDKNWQRFVVDINVGLPFLRRRATELGEAIRDRAATVCESVHKPGLDEKALSTLGAAITARAEIFLLKAPTSTGVGSAAKKDQ